MLHYCCFLVEIYLIREKIVTYFFATWTQSTTRRKTTKTVRTPPSQRPPSHLFNRARLGGRPQRSILTFEGGVGPPARVLSQKST